MDKKTKREKGMRVQNRNQEQGTGEKQTGPMDPLPAATREDLMIAINEMQDGIILEVYFDSRS